MNRIPYLRRRRIKRNKKPHCIHKFGVRCEILKQMQCKDCAFKKEVY